MTAVPTVPAWASGVVPVEKLQQLSAVETFLLSPPIAVLLQSVAQSLTSATFTSLTLDVETVDSAGGHDTVTNTSRYTAVYPGWYEVGGGTGYAANVTGRRGARWAVNGTAINGSGVLIPTNSSGTTQVPARTIQVYLNVGDYVELQGYQDSGGALNTAVSTDQQSCMSIRWVSN